MRYLPFTLSTAKLEKIFVICKGIMAKEKRVRKQIYRKLQNKFRLVVMNDQTFEEKISIRLSPINVFVFIGTLTISLITFTIYIIAFTPLREYIPGYADVNMKRKLVSLSLKTDSLAIHLVLRSNYRGSANRLSHSDGFLHESETNR